MVSGLILEELQEKLLTKAGLSPSETKEVIAALRADAEVVETQPLSEHSDLGALDVDRCVGDVPIPGFEE